MRIGEVIQRERLARGVSIRRLAGASGVSSTTIANYEAGRTDPTPAILLRIARGFGMRLSGLLGIPEEPDDGPDMDCTCEALRLARCGGVIGDAMVGQILGVSTETAMAISAEWLQWYGLNDKGEII